MWFWTCKGSEYAMVIQGSEYAWIIPANAIIYLNKSEYNILNKSEYAWYAGICVNMPNSAWMAFFYISRLHPI